MYLFRHLSPFPLFPAFFLKWLALLTTDTDLPEEEVIRIYGKRWNIEVFFKRSSSRCPNPISLWQRVSGTFL